MEKVSVFKHLTERFSEYVERNSDKETDHPDIENVMGTAGKALFDAISSGKIHLGDIPSWFRIEPKGTRIGDNGKGESKDFVVHSWDLYWLYAVNWLANSKPDSGITFPGHIRGVNPEKYLQQGLDVWEFLVYVCGLPRRGNMKTWRELAMASEDACLYLAGEAVRDEKPAETEQKAERSKIMITARTTKENWEAIRSEYNIRKPGFGRKINFVSDPFKRKIIFRDVEHAFVLASQGFSKPGLILAGGVIEELLRLYLEHKNIKPKNDRFVDYIKACEDNDLLKRGVSRLSDSIRDFRNLVHLANEKTERHTVSKATAKGAVSSIFTIANDFQ